MGFTSTVSDAAGGVGGRARGNNLHFSKVPRGCWCCLPESLFENHSSKTSKHGLNSSLRSQALNMPHLSFTKPTESSPQFIEEKSKD